VITTRYVQAWVMAEQVERKRVAQYFISHVRNLALSLALRHRFKAKHSTTTTPKTATSPAVTR
jgi:hypothetical protein